MKLVIEGVVKDIEDGVPTISVENITEENSGERSERVSLYIKAKVRLIHMKYNRKRKTSKKRWTAFSKVLDKYSPSDLDEDTVVRITALLEKCAKKDRYFTVQADSRIAIAVDDVDVHDVEEIYSALCSTAHDTADTIMTMDRICRMLWLAGLLFDIFVDKGECCVEKTERHEEYLIGYN